MTTAEVAVAVQLVDYYVAFPAKAQDRVLNDLIELAIQAPLGHDGRPQVAIHTFPSHGDASKAANSIRAHCQNRKLALRVSCPEGANTVRVYRAETPTQ